jgi:hypothetical protein
MNHCLTGDPAESAIDFEVSIRSAHHLAAERGNSACLQILLNQPDIEVGTVQ